MRRFFQQHCCFRLYRSFWCRCFRRHTIKVGVLGPLTGDVSVYGQAVVNGAALYLNGSTKGINGKQLEIIAMDEQQGDATRAVTNFTKMCDQGITALVGDVTTTPTLALAAGAQTTTCPAVTASATAGAMPLRCRDRHRERENVFRATFTDPFQGIKMADYAYQRLGYTKAAVIFQKGADYNGLAENFVA